MKNKGKTTVRRNNAILYTPSYAMHLIVAVNNNSAFIGRRRSNTGNRRLPEGERVGLSSYLMTQKIAPSGLSFVYGRNCKQQLDTAAILERWHSYTYT